MAMYVLDSTTKTIKVAMSAAAATTNPDYTVAYADNNGTVFTEGAADGVLNGTADVTVCSAPATSTRRIVKAMTINNRDTAAVTLYIKYDNNGTQRRLTAVTLGVNETWTMDGTFNITGAIKQVQTIENSPYISSISGVLISALQTSLTISGLYFSGSVLVRFTYNVNNYDVAANSTSNGTAISVAVPSAIYNLTSGTNFSVSVINAIGLKSNEVTKTMSVAPTGGTISNYSGYRIHAFTSSGSFVLPAQTTVEYMVVAGGGGAGHNMGGGGGAGGYLAGTGLSLPAGTYAITVGAGGNGEVAGYNNGNPRASVGSNSVFSTFTAIGGGGGGNNYSSNTGGAGGSGGGGTASNGAGGAGTAGQGYAGGSGGTSYYQGGGGGAGGVGVGTTGHSLQANGGPGVLNSILGIGYYWAGGGAGAGYSGYGGNGGAGGGGGGSPRNAGGGVTTGTGDTSGINPGSDGQNGAINTEANKPGGSGGTNTGGGGGGGSHYQSNNAGGNGGSGMVVIRYVLA